MKQLLVYGFQITEHFCGWYANIILYDQNYKKQAAVLSRAASLNVTDEK